MAQRDSFSVRLAPEKRERLDRLAAAMDRPRSWVVGQAIDQYLEYHAWKADRVAEGEEAVARGDLVSHEELFDGLRSRFDAKRS